MKLEDINDQLETIGFRNLGVKARPNLVVLKRTKMPSSPSKRLNGFYQFRHGQSAL
ncbi:MAG: hypothetical protein ACLUUO_10480 [Sellimonas intestinalis]